MTDIEIIETFENNCNSCENCPYHIYSDCDDRNRKDILDLIKRQQSKIEALEMENEQLKSDISNALMNADHMTELYNDAIKEFAERLIRKSELMSMSVYAVPERAVLVSDIENIAKEMTGDEEK